MRPSCARSARLPYLAYACMVFSALPTAALGRAGARHALTSRMPLRSRLHTRLQRQWSQAFAIREALRGALPPDHPPRHVGRPGGRWRRQATVRGPLATRAWRTGDRGAGVTIRFKSQCNLSEDALATSDTLLRPAAGPLVVVQYLRKRDTALESLPPLTSCRASARACLEPCDHGAAGGRLRKSRARSGRSLLRRRRFRSDVGRTSASEIRSHFGQASPAPPRNSLAERKELDARVPVRSRAPIAQICAHIGAIPAPDVLPA